MRWKGILVSLLLSGVSAAGSPNDMALAAAEDILKVPLEDRKYTRYLTSYAVRESRRSVFEKVQNFHVNQLSRNRLFYAPFKVMPVLYRIDLRHYRWKVETWEKMYGVEPHFHEQPLTPLNEVKVLVPVPVPETEVEEEKEVKVNKPWPGGIWQGDGPEKGKYFPQGAFQILVPEKQKVKTRKPINVGEVNTPPKPSLVTKEAFWVSPIALATLYKETHSKVPIVRGDWFIYQTAQQEDRVVGYYDFLDLGDKQEDFFKLIFARIEDSQAAGIETAAIMAKSGVTVKNRTMSRFKSITGCVWVTQDFKKSTGLSNALRFFDKHKQPPQGDASEQYGVLPNGLFAYWLQNKDKKRQNVAPPFIASDKEGATNDAQVHICVSCIRCHVEGIRPIDDWARKVYKGRNSLDSPDYNESERLKQLYTENLLGLVDEDQKAYAKRLFELTGWKPAELASNYYKIWEEYAANDLTPDDYARELGVDVKQMMDQFQRRAFPAKAPDGKVNKDGGGLDPGLMPLITTEKVNGKEVLKPVPLIRDHADELFPEAQRVIRGYRP